MTVSADPAPDIGAEVTVVTGSGELDIASRSFHRALETMITEAQPCAVVDLLDATFVDSSVVNALVLATTQAEALGGWVRIVYTHHLIRRVIEICGLSEILPQHVTVAAALRGTAAAPPESERDGGRR